MDRFLSKTALFFLLLKLFTVSGKSDQEIPAKSSRNWPCPIQEDIQPCECLDDGFGNLDLVCSAIQNEQELQNALAECGSKFPFMNMRDFLIEHSGGENLTTLSSETLCLLTFEKIEITGTKLTVIEENVFVNSEESLHTLILSNNEIYEFPFGVLPLYTALIELSLENNNIDVLEDIISNSLEIIRVNYNENLNFGSNVFSLAPQLKLISMNSIDLASLPAGVFQLSSLEVVFLSNNDLVTLVAGTFNSSSTLNLISLDNNALTSVEVDAITGVARGASISLSNNELKFIEQDVWQPVMQEMDPSGNLDFSNNPIRCGCEIKWLFDVSEAMNYIDDDTTCYSGSPFLSELPYEAFEYHCE